MFGIIYNKVKETWCSNKKYTHDYDDSKIEKIFNEDGTYKELPIEPDEWINNQDFHKILSQELEKLTENQRMAFYLKEIQGEDTESICKMMGISNTNLGVLIYRAKNNFKISLEKEFKR